MNKFERICDVGEGNFGLVSFAEAKGIGVSIRELSRWTKKGRLEKIARGVYRISRFPFSEFDPYATAVATVGPDAFIFGESVLAMLHLVPTNPTSISVASPKRVRKAVGMPLS